MKPFDLKKAKAGYPIVTRDGRGAKFIAYLPECGEEFRVVALISGDESITTFSSGGRLVIAVESPEDLFLATTKTTWWMGVEEYGANDEKRVTTCLYSTEALACAVLCPDMKLISVELEE